MQLQYVIATKQQYYKSKKYRQIMRIFISMPDQTGSHKTTRLTLINCQDTAQLIQFICKELQVNKNAFIFVLKNQIMGLRILQNWPLAIYGIKNGSWITLKENQLFNKKQLSNSTTFSLQKIQEAMEEVSQDVDNSFDSEEKRKSSVSKRSQEMFHQYYEKELAKMLSFIRDNKLQQIAMVLKQQPDIEDQNLRSEILAKKNNYILNQVGQCGRNCLHWAIHNQNVQIVSFLLMKFVNPTVQTIDEYTPLQLAVIHRNLEIVNILLAQPKVDPNKVTSHGTALHLAAYHHSIPLVKQLLAHGANPQQVDKDGKKPIELSQIKQIKSLFEDYEKKLNLRFLKPNITKGDILKITNLTYRQKQRVMMVNPFKNQLSIFKENNVLDHKIKITSIKEVSKITQKTLLMDKKLNYFRIAYIVDKDQEKIIFAIKHVQILGKWLQSLETARIYVNNQKYVSKIQPQMQLIEMLDDVKNQIKVHKRQVDSKKKQSPAKSRYSIIDMKVSNQPIPQPQNISFSKIAFIKSPKKRSQPEVHFQESQQLKNSFSSIAGQQKDLRESQILIGSILSQKSYELIEERNTVSTLSISKTNHHQQPHFFTEPQKQVNFRKKSVDLVEVSEFKSEQKIQEKAQEKAAQKKKITFNDFQFKKLLGQGAFGQVYLTKQIRTEKIFAMKVLNKKKLMAKKQLKYAVSETNILKRVNHPFIIGLHYSFQTPSNLYLALDYCPYGDLSQFLCQKEQVSEMTARFIIAQAILAIQHLHKLKIIYRDLKPQNILIAKDGYIKLIDFGLSKQNHLGTSFCGSPAYLSPQMLQKKGHSYPTDIYGLGCVLYEMVVGEPPYFDENMDQMLDNIRSARLKFPGYITKQIRSLLTRMLERDISKRIGSSNMDQLKKHEFFKGFSWQKLLSKQLSVPKQLFSEEFEQYYKLQKNLQNQGLKYVDQDYTQKSMLNRIKAFSFSREDDVNK